MEHLTLLQKLRTIALLCVCFFSIGLVVIAPIELYAVHRVRAWDTVNAEIISSEVSRVRSWNRLHEVTKVQFRVMDTADVITISDVRPGDLPFEVSFFNSTTWSTNRADMRLYTQGQPITVYRSPNGKDYFLEQGSYHTMTLLLVGSLLWWITLFVLVKRGKSYG